MLSVDCRVMLSVDLQSQMVLEEQVEDQHKALEKTHFSNSHHDNYKKHLEEELSAVKRVGGGFADVRCEQ